MTESERSDFEAGEGAGSSISGSRGRDESIAAPDVAQALLRDMAGLRSQLARVTGSI